MGWTAIYLPVSDNYEGLTKSGFVSEEEAWKYVGEHVCSMCLDDIENGKCDEPSETSCGAEWLVITDKYFDDSNGLPDLMEMAGYKRRWNKEDG